ncbi:MAG: hypothetical protein PCFJNLEI_02093 [Verrucomicrobiae bacterium]|nr:hypothetical protein [Verrucomicrobiae bacterium]
MRRNFSINQHFRSQAAGHVPRYRFRGQTTADWRRWRTALLPAVTRTLGRLPARVPLRPEVECEWTEDGLIKQRVVFDVERGLAVPALVFRPVKSRGRLPAILCCHGHGAYGKDTVMGLRTTPDLCCSIDYHNADYGLQMAKAGFVTLSLDWRGFGERDDRRKPLNHNIGGKGDLCNAHSLRASVFGQTILGLNVHDGRCALDYLSRQPFVDPQRLGVMGLSFGGTMTTWLSISDARIKAANIICYSDRFADFGIRDVNFCGSQITFGLYELADVPDLHGLIAPRPLLVEIGVQDECFLVDSARSCYREVEKIYRAAGVRDRLELDLFEGGHAWGGHKSVEFFLKHL